ncbi:MAG: hypothetical protein JWM93_2032 [Frankiales bacterium]|nr:hypothetical protein [Frankiales bacterium]
MTEGPGGREGGRVNIRVVPSSAKFRDELLAQLEKIERTTSLTIDTKVNAVSLRREVDRAVTAASASAKKLTVRSDVDTSQLDNFTAAVSRVDKSLGRNGGGASRLKLYAGLGAAASLAVPGVLSLAGSLEKVAGAGLLLPAVLAGVATGVGALVVGFQGIGDALKNAGDPEKFAAALGNLAPAARKSALAMLALKDSLRGLRLSVQQSLFAGMSTEITRLGQTLIPVMRKGLTDTATQANRAAKEFTQFATSAGTVRDLNKSFANIAQSFRNLGPAVQPFLRAMRDIGTVGSGFLPALATSLTNVSKKFDAFISTARGTGELKGWIQGGVDAIKQLGSVLGSSFRILQGFIKAAGKAGGGVLSGLADVLKRVADTVNGPAFQKGLTSFFKGLNTGFTALGSAMPALGEALAALGPPLGALAAGVGKVLAHAIEALTPAIVKMAPAVTQLVEAFTKLASGSIDVIAPLLGNIATAATFIVQNVPGATVAISALLLALGARGIANVVGLGGALSKLGTIIKGVGQNSNALAALKIGFEAKDVALSGQVAGNLGRVGAVAGKASGAIGVLKGMLPKLGLAGLAVGGIMYGLQLRLDAVRKANDTAAEAADRLKASFDKGKQSVIEFAAENTNAIKKLRGLTTVGQNAYLVQIGFELIHDGMTPKEAFAQVQRLADSAGVSLPIDFTVGALTSTKAQLAAIGDQAKILVSQITVAGGGMTRFGTIAEGVGVIGTKTKEDLDALGKSAFDAFDAGNFSGGIAQINAFEQAVKGSSAEVGAQKAAIEQVSDALLRSFGPTLGVSTQNTKNLRDALTELTKSNAPAELKRYAQSVLDASAGSDDFTAAIAKVNAEQPKVAEGAKAAAAQLTRQQVAATLLRESLDQLAAALTRSIGGNIGLKAAQADVLNSGVELSKSIVKNGNDFRITTVAGRANIAAMNSLATSFGTAAAESVKWGQDHGRTTDQVRADIEALRKKLVDEMVQAGLSRTAAQKLAEEYLKIPKKTPTKATFDATSGMTKANAWKVAVLKTVADINKKAAAAGKKTGEDFATGLAAGISQKSGVVEDRARAVMQAGIDAAKRVADSHSPSRVMIAVGKDFTLGLAIGIQGNAHLAVAASSSGAKAVVAAWKVALGSITNSLKAQPSSTDDLTAAYDKVRLSLAATVPGQVAANQAYDAAKQKTAALREELRKFTSAQSVNSAATAAATASARRYLQTQLDTAREQGASKKRIAGLVADIRALGSAHTASGSAARAAAAVTKAALQDQIAAAVKAQGTAKAAADKAKTAYQSALQAAKDAARALVDSVQAQSDTLIAAIDDFRARMTDAIQGGAFDIAAMWGASTQQVDDVSVFVPGTVEQLKAALDARLATVETFAKDLNALAAAGASQDLIAEIAGMGPGTGDVLAKQLLDGGPAAVRAISDVMKRIQDAAGAGASNLAKSFYQPGVDAITTLIKGMRKSFPELAKELQAIADLVNSTLGPALASVATMTKYTADNAKAQRPVSVTPATTGNLARAVTATASSARVSVVPVTPDASVVSRLDTLIDATRDTTTAVAATNSKLLMLKRSGAA